MTEREVLQSGTRAEPARPRATPATIARQLVQCSEDARAAFGDDLPNQLRYILAALVNADPSESALRLLLELAHAAFALDPHADRAHPHKPPQSQPRGLVDRVAPSNAQSSHAAEHEAAGLAEPSATTTTSAIVKREIAQGATESATHAQGAVGAADARGTTDAEMHHRRLHAAHDPIAVAAPSAASAPGPESRLSLGFGSPLKANLLSPLHLSPRSPLRTTHHDAEKNAEPKTNHEAEQKSEQPPDGSDEKKALDAEQNAEPKKNYKANQKLKQPPDGSDEKKTPDAVAAASPRLSKCLMRAISNKGLASALAAGSAFKQAREVARARFKRSTYSIGDMIQLLAGAVGDDDAGKLFEMFDEDNSYTLAFDEFAKMMKHLASTAHGNDVAAGTEERSAVTNENDASTSQVALLTQRELRGLYKMIESSHNEVTVTAFREFFELSRQPLARVTVQAKNTITGVSISLDKRFVTFRSARATSIM